LEDWFIASAAVVVTEVQKKDEPPLVNESTFSLMKLKYVRHHMRVSKRVYMSYENSHVWRYVYHGRELWLLSPIVTS